MRMYTLHLHIYTDELQGCGLNPSSVKLWRKALARQGTDKNADPVLGSDKECVFLGLHFTRAGCIYLHPYESHRMTPLVCPMASAHDCFHHSVADCLPGA